MNKRRSYLLLILLASTVFVWTLTLWSRTEILQLDRGILQQEKELELLCEEEERLRSLYYTPVDLEEQEKAALALGMDRPRREQLVCSETVLPDVITVEGAQKGFWEKIGKLFSLS